MVSILTVTGDEVTGRLTLVKKSLHPAASASCLSLCSELAVSATMMTGLLNTSMFSSLSSGLGSPFSPSGLAPSGAKALLAAPEKTPIELTRSRRLISLVASSPLMMGSWMSISTRWNPPVRHLSTASRPFMAVDQRTLRRLTKASRSLRLMMLSSTIRTLMGGTPLLRMPLGRAGGAWSLVFFFLDFEGPAIDVWGAIGRGETVRGGGVDVRCMGTIDGTELGRSPAGGVGMGGAGGGCALVDWSEEALE